MRGRIGLRWRVRGGGPVLMARMCLLMARSMYAPYIRNIHTYFFVFFLLPIVCFWMGDAFWLSMWCAAPLAETMRTSSKLNLENFAQYNFSFVVRTILVSKNSRFETWAYTKISRNFGPFSVRTMHVTCWPNRICGGYLAILLLDGASRLRRLGAPGCLKMPMLYTKQHMRAKPQSAIKYSTLSHFCLVVGSCMPCCRVGGYDLCGLRSMGKDITLSSSTKKETRTQAISFGFISAYLCFMYC